MPEQPKSEFFIEDNPVILIDETSEIPEDIKQRVSYQYASKIFYNTPVKDNKYCKVILIINEFSTENIATLIKDSLITNIACIYVITGLKELKMINGKIPVFPIEMVGGINKSLDISTNAFKMNVLDAICRNFEYNKILVPWENEGKISWNIASGVLFQTTLPAVLNDRYPRSYYLCWFLKVKNYDERKRQIKNINNMINDTDPFIDEIVMVGDPDFITKERFYQKEGGVHKVSYYTHSSMTLGKVFDYAWKTFSKNSIVYICRGDIYSNNNIGTFYFSRFPKKIIGTTSPMIIPDIPDPKPEIYLNGGPESSMCCFYRSNKRPIPSEDARLNSINIYEGLCMWLVMTIAYTRGLTITNPSYIFMNRVDSDYKRMLLSTRLTRTRMLTLPPASCVVSSKNDTRHVLQSFDSENIIIPKLKCLTKGSEIKTLLNMTNKYQGRKKCGEWILSNEKDTEINMKETALVSTKNCYYKEHTWYNLTNSEGRTYNNTYIDPKEQKALLRCDFVKQHTGLIEGIAQNNVKNIVALLCNNYIYSSTTHNTSNDIMIFGPKDLKDKINDNILFKDMCRMMDITFNFENLEKGFYLGSEKTHTFKRDEKCNYLGYDPRMIRLTNRMLRKKISREIEIKDICNEISGKEGDSECIGIVIGSQKWKKTITTLLTKQTKIKLIDSSDAHLDDYINASYLIGEPSESTDWLYTLFVDSNKCRIIEIALEHDCNVDMYYFGAVSIGCDHYYLSLKQEPVKECRKKIKQYLLAYIREEDLLEI
jgi:hypothetical protein